MKPRLLSILRCPVCKSNLAVQTYRRDETKEILDGVLTCTSCNAWFPIITGVPRMLLGSLQRDLVLAPHTFFLKSYKNLLHARKEEEWRAAVYAKSDRRNLKVKTASSFGYEWNTFLSKTLQDKSEVYRRDFLGWISPITGQFFDGKVVLEAGCGVGRHTYLAAQYNPKELIAIDLSEAVRASYENTKKFPNVHVVQADIYHLPFMNIFDYVFSIGVLHHLPQPEEGFQSLVSHLKPCGTISLWVYGRRHNFFHVYFNETVRLITRKLPYRFLHLLCYVSATGIAITNLLYRALKRFRVTSPLARFMPFKIYADLPFAVKLNDAFDVFATPRSTYWEKEEIEEWFSRTGIFKFNVEEYRKKSLKAY